MQQSCLALLQYPSISWHQYCSWYRLSLSISLPSSSSILLVIIVVCCWAVPIVNHCQCGVCIEGRPWFSVSVASYYGDGWVGCQWRGMGRGIRENEHDFIAFVLLTHWWAFHFLIVRPLCCIVWPLHCVVQLYTLSFGLLGCCLVCGVIVLPSLLLSGHSGCRLQVVVATLLWLIGVKNKGEVEMSHDIHCSSFGDAPHGPPNSWVPPLVPPSPISTGPHPSWEARGIRWAVCVLLGSTCFRAGLLD